MRVFYNGVVEGMLPAAGPGRVVTMPAGVAVIDEQVVTTAQFTKLLGANADFDVHLDRTGKFRFVFSEYIDPAPDLPEHCILVCRIRTDAEDVTFVTDLRDMAPAVAYSDVAPVAGDHLQGAIVMNDDPNDGDYVGWVCTVTGTPGTWEGFGVVGDIDTAHIANDAIDTAQIADGAVVADKIEDGAVTADKLATDAVTTDKIDDGAVTFEKTAGIGVLYYLGDPLLAVDDDIVGSTNMIVGDYTLSSDPADYTMDVPRIVTVTRTAVGAEDTGGTITVSGTDIAGSNIVDVITVGADGVTVEGTGAFATVTQVTGAGWVVDEGNDTIEIGFGDDLGLPVIPSDILISILGTDLVEADGTVSIALAQCMVDMSSAVYDGTKKAFVFLGH